MRELVGGRYSGRGLRVKAERQRRGGLHSHDLAHTGRQRRGPGDSSVALGRGGVTSMRRETIWPLGVATAWPLREVFVSQPEVGRLTLT